MQDKFDQTSSRFLLLVSSIFGSIGTLICLCSRYLSSNAAIKKKKKEKFKLLDNWNDNHSRLDRKLTRDQNVGR